MLRATAPGSEPDQIEQLHLCARSLEISDYELFRRAYTTWHGHAPPLNELELRFHDYLSRAELPTWVRHFCRQYLQTHPEALSRQQADAAQARWANWLALGLIMLSVLLALLL